MFSAMLASFIVLILVSKNLAQKLHSINFYH